MPPCVFYVYISCCVGSTLRDPQAEALGRETPPAPTVDELGWAWSSSSDLDSVRVRDSHEIEEYLLFAPDGGWMAGSLHG
eukprot:4401192-Pleurochrysis_carterae.AAC.1